MKYLFWTLPKYYIQHQALQLNQFLVTKYDIMPHGMWVGKYDRLFSLGRQEVSWNKLWRYIRIDSFFLIDRKWLLRLLLTKWRSARLLVWEVPKKESSCSCTSLVLLSWAIRHQKNLQMVKAGQGVWEHNEQRLEDLCAPCCMSVWCQLSRLWLC